MSDFKVECMVNSGSILDWTKLNELFGGKQQEEEEKAQDERSEVKRGRKPKAKKDDSYTSYNFADIVYFIGLVERTQEIWNPQHPDWNKGRVRMARFAQIEERCKQFMPHSARTFGRCAKDRWDELVKDYAVHMLNSKKSLLETGSLDDVSTFPFAAHMRFTCMDQKQAREINANPCYDFPAPSFVEPPKRKIENVDDGFRRKMPKLEAQSDSVVTTIKEEITKLREDIAKLVSAQTNSTTPPSICESERICKVFESVVSGKSLVERLEMESQVILFITSMHGKGASGESRFREQKVFQRAQDGDFAAQSTSSSSHS